MDSFFRLICECNDQSFLLYNQLKMELNAAKYISKSFKFTRVENTHCFRIYWESCEVGLSISYPFDCNRNHERFGWTIETALYNVQTGDILYLSNVDYEDIRRFSTFDELVDEIHRLSKLQQIDGCFVVMNSSESDCDGDCDGDCGELKNNNIHVELNLMSLGDGDSDGDGDE